MKRTKALRRGKPLSRTPLRPKKRSAAKQAAKFAREFGSKDRVEWMQRQTCVGCVRRAEHNHHVKTDGMGRKASAEFIVPVCEACHREIHQQGAQTFERNHRHALVGGTLLEWAGIYDRAYQRFLKQPTPLSAIVPGVVADLLTKGDA